MSRRTRIGLVVTSTFLVSGFVLVAVIAPGDSVTRALAVLSFVLALTNTVYSIREKERERQRKDVENKERVKAQALCRRNPATGQGVDIGVSLYNEGVSLIHIKQVALVLRTATGEVRQPLWTNERLTREEKVPVFFEKADQTARLEPKGHTEFWSRSSDPLFKGDNLHSLPPDSFWIVVESYACEVTRVPGNQIQDQIRKMRTLETKSA